LSLDWLRNLNGGVIGLFFVLSSFLSLLILLCGCWGTLSSLNQVSRYHKLCGYFLSLLTDDGRILFLRSVSLGHIYYLHLLNSLALRLIALWQLGVVFIISVHIGLMLGRAGRWLDLNDLFLIVFVVVIQVDIIIYNNMIFFQKGVEAPDFMGKVQGQASRMMGRGWRLTLRFLGWSQLCRVLIEHVRCGDFWLGLLVLS